MRNPFRGGVISPSLNVRGCQLLAKDTSKVDSRAPITFAEFLAHAWEAANAKARELGWIA